MTSFECGSESSERIVGLFIGAVYTAAPVLRTYSDILRIGTIRQPDFEIIYNDARLAGLSQYLDELHSAASEGQLPAVTPLSDEELLGWLQEMIYTASETLVEIQQHRTQYAVPHLRLVK